MEDPESIIETMPEMPEMHLFVTPPDLLDINNQKHIIIPLEPIDLSNNQNCTCKGIGCDECLFEGLALQGGIPEKANLKLPFAFYILIKNNWNDIDDDTHFYAFKAQILPKTEDCVGNKMMCLTDAIYMGSSSQFEKKSTKSKMAVILHFNDGILKLVQIVITKLDQIVVTKIPASLIDGKEE
jgi:hypothetical protein